MGKQINYYMDYESFLKIAELALSEGCLILKNTHTPEPQQPQNDTSIVTEDCMRYYFYLPELAELEYKKDMFGTYYINNVGNKLTLALIEAGFSKNHGGEDTNKPPSVNIARLYISTGNFRSNGVLYQRSERIKEIYDKLARLARKVAPRTTLEIDDVIFDEDNKATPTKVQCKVYASSKCLEWRKQGYELYWLLAAKERYEKYCKTNE